MCIIQIPSPNIPTYNLNIMCFWNEYKNRSKWMKIEPNKCTKCLNGCFVALQKNWFFPFYTLTLCIVLASNLTYTKLQKKKIYNPQNVQTSHIVNGKNYNISFNKLAHCINYVWVCRYTVYRGIVHPPTEITINR